MLYSLQATSNCWALDLPLVAMKISCFLLRLACAPIYVSFLSVWFLLRLSILVGLDFRAPKYEDATRLLLVTKCIVEKVKRKAKLRKYL